MEVICQMPEFNCVQSIHSDDMYQQQTDVAACIERSGERCN